MAVNNGMNRASTVVALAIMATTATHAAPLTSSATRLKATVGAIPSLDKVASWRCWWRNGRQRCRTYGPPAQRRSTDESDYYVHDSTQLPFGSKRWWDQKESEGSLGRP